MVMLPGVVRFSLSGAAHDLSVRGSQLESAPVSEKRCTFSGVFGSETDRVLSKMTLSKFRGLERGTPRRSGVPDITKIAA